MSEVNKESLRRMRIDEFAHFHYVGAMRVTRNSEALVYALSTVNMRDNEYETNLWMIDLATGKKRQLTNSGKEGHFDLLDDGSVLFASRRLQGKRPHTSDNKGLPDSDFSSEAQIVSLGFEKSKDILAQQCDKGTDLFRIALDGGEATLFVHVPLEVLDWYQLDNCRFLLRARDLRDTEASYATLTDVPFWTNGDTYHSGLRWGIYLMDMSKVSGEPDYPIAQLRLLTAPHEGVDGWILSPDRQELYYFSNTYDYAAPVKTLLRAIHIGKSDNSDNYSYETRDLAQAPRMYYQGIACAKDRSDTDKLLLLGTDMKAHGLNEEPYAYVCSAQDGSDFHRIVDDDFFADVFNAVGSDCRHGRGNEQLSIDNALLFIRSVGDSSYLSRVNLDGTVMDLIADEGSIETIDTLDGRTIYYVAMHPNMLPEIYRRTVNKDGVTVITEEQLTNYSETDLVGLDIADYETFEFESGGDSLTGYVLKPIDYQADHGPLTGGKYPGILWVHGGPKCTQGRLLFHELQYLRGLGYYVFFTNPHGAGGRSREFMDIFGHYGEQDYADLMTFTDEVLARYSDLAADRLAEMGGSYGGFMTNWIIGHTDRFKCANSQRSISNWTSKFGVADIGYYFNNDQTKGDPWNHVERMWNQSPLKYADKCVTPTLFLHSDCDYRCPLDQGLQMFTALQLHNCPARMVIFKGENHDLSRSGKPQARVRRLAEISNWYARWLKDEPNGEPALKVGSNINKSEDGS